MLFISMFTPHSKKCCFCLLINKQRFNLKRLEDDSESEIALNCINVLLLIVYRKHCVFVEF